MCRADAITVVSETTAADVRATFGDSMTLPPIFVVYPAVGEHFLTLSVNDTEQLRVKYALPARFMLSVGTFEPRKNLHRLLDAYAMLDETLRAQCPLLLVGEKGWLADGIVTKLNTVRHVRWLGYVAEADMPSLYQLADVFIYPSLFEGFGMPIVEALAVGTRVITSNRGAMKEAAAGQADLVNPEDTLAISKLLAEVITCTNIHSDSRLVNRQPLSVHTWRERKSAMLSILYQMSD
ncbi:MAG: hypothetical protein BWK73_21265 [Thiothrix lacustris]|uniref:Glycosyl transferase family 1 domain-containing protein n=1 Tax=Thiothrix lacustris TaxID=525917 RepID=A0A1Y1QNK1_9GAMM|nr:MAG: hypothetical protein BWK73_21265 [Thiothrix lacustris]